MSAVTFLGLAKKAGRIESGEETVAMCVRAGRAKLVLIASDAGRSARGFERNDSYPAVTLNCGKSELGAVLGRETVSVACLTDIGFASAFVDKLSAETPGLEELKAELDLARDRAAERKKERPQKAQKRKKQR